MPNAGREALHCSLWQIAQVGPLDFEIRYVPLADEARPDERAFTSLFRAIYFEDATVTFRRVPSIPPAKSGKYAEYVNET
jgi:phenylacetate-CoA ligase